MKIIILILVCISSICNAQDKTAYEIYSTVLRKQFIDWKVNIDTISEIVVTDNLTKFNDKEDICSMIDEILKGGDQNIADVAMGYNDNISKTFKNDSVRKSLAALRTGIMNPTNLINNEFRVLKNVTVVSYREIEKLFKSRHFDKNWQKFHKRHKSPGYFEFSSVSYFDNYATIYVARRANPLNGNGRLVVLKKQNSIWSIESSIYLWHN